MVFGVACHLAGAVSTEGSVPGGFNLSIRCSPRYSSAVKNRQPVPGWTLGCALDSHPSRSPHLADGVGYEGGVEVFGGQVAAGVGECGNQVGRIDDDHDAAIVVERLR